MRSLHQALMLLTSGDKETWRVIATTLGFSFWSTLASMLPGVPCGVALFLGKFRGKRLLSASVNALMTLPTVVVGLFVYSLISRSGPLGAFGLLYTPGGVVLGQSVLAFPLVVAMVYTGLQKLDPRYHETLLTLGAGYWRRLLGIVNEGRFVILQAVMAAFGRVAGEVGVAMMLGGNIRYYTRTMTTSIALEAAKGNFEHAVAIGLVLLFLSLLINILTHLAVQDAQRS